MQRLRVTFARDGAAKYLSHLEVMKAWERAFRRAGWKLAYSQGFNPHPKLSFAAPLPVGVAAEAELLDVQLEAPLEPGGALGDLAAHAPPGIEVRGVEELPADAPRLQHLLTGAEYVAVCPTGVSSDRLATEVRRVLEATSLPRRRSKEGRVQQYDLRPLVLDLRLHLAGTTGVERIALEMALRMGAQGSGRADEVLLELGLDPAECEITRTRLILEI